MATQLAQTRALDTTPAIPDRLYFKIGDVARIADLETYVLRFWESQFPQLHPNKSGTGQRLYRRRDVELVLEIKRLVYGEGYTLAGARHALEQVHRHPATQVGPQREAQPTLQMDSQPRLPLMTTASTQRLESVAASISHIRAELIEIAGLLGAPASHQPRRRTRMTALPAPVASLFPS